ncbi:FimV/HubP family polar landmark protein [Alkalimonas mucilaginosa]|uniref:FimV/HubP family polar landmark protein n=1 Tax=Alkalimonas mucilaginosa TaxID=3057676 RepID=A0ABU7JFZ1_9GAMM|nr:FimV/HubP family polar landmark protein [Alkalimonas sp. MEB004]MEE2024547.1 FimV/HubP family polar landmark protein [Alkalimonas sp. MEB004]
MQLWRILFLICLVNISTLAVASDGGTSIRGPRATDQQSRLQQLGPITPTDTLWRLAQQVQPEGTDMYQVMYALYLKNPHAFLDNNFNHLRTGAMLEVPNLREIRAVDPAVARQKSSADDESWARRMRAARQTAAEPAAEAPSQQLQQAVERLEQEQQQQLQQLRHRFGESMLLVESIMEDNQSLKHSLGSLQQQLDALKEQMAQDAEMQRELEQMVRLQAEWMAQQQAQLEADAERGFAASWQQLAANPAFWVLSASVPALGVLLGLLFWIKRRSKRAEATIEAATSEPKTAANYQSPLPEVDDNLDIDDSLFSLDDSLLDDAFNEEMDDSPVDLTDDLLDDEVLLDDSSIQEDSLFDDDDALLDDDSLLDTDLSSDTASAGTTELDEADASDAFDPDNILSGSDLDSLFAESDETESVLDDTSDELEDELLEEIELDIPEDEQELMTDQELTAGIDTELETDQEQPEIEGLAEDLVSDTDFSPEQELSADLTDLLADEPTETADTELVQFNSTELDAFAESLVEESLEQELDEQTMPPEQELAEELSTDAFDEDMNDADIDALLADSSTSDSSDELEEQQLEAATEAEYLNDYADLEDDFPSDVPVEPEQEAPNLTEQDDNSVQPPSAASLSVENPSEVLEQYPELELSAEEPASGSDTSEAEYTADGDFDDAILAEQEPAEDMSEDAIEGIQLDDDDTTDFDQLLSELEQMAERVSEHEDGTPDVTEPLTDEATATERLVSDDDFQDIDQLLAQAADKSLQPQEPEFDTELEDEPQGPGLDAVAGLDDEYAAQLDLIHAYLEMDDVESAEQVIKEVMNSDAPEAIKQEVSQLHPNTKKD